MTDDDKALVERLFAMADEYDSGHHESWPTIDALEIAAHRIEALSAEIERLRLDVEAQEALQVSAYHAGMRAGWNFGVSDDNAGMQAAMANTDHIKELRRIREARAALGEKQ